MYLGGTAFLRKVSLAQENHKKKRGKELLYWSAGVSKLRGGTAFLTESFPSSSRKKTKKRNAAKNCFIGVQGCQNFAVGLLS